MSILIASGYRKGEEREGSSGKEQEHVDVRELLRDFAQVTVCVRACICCGMMSSVRLDHGTNSIRLGMCAWHWLGKLVSCVNASSGKGTSNAGCGDGPRKRFVTWV